MKPNNRINSNNGDVSTSLDAVANAAIDHFNERLRYFEEKDLDRGKEYVERERVSIRSDKDLLDRITVNYIRHELSAYDQKIDHLFGKIGKHEAFQLLNRKIYAEIGRVFPQLQEEAQRQLEAKRIPERKGLLCGMNSTQKSWP